MLNVHNWIRQGWLIYIIKIIIRERGGRGRERESVCVCVCERERERERERRLVEGSHEDFYSYRDFASLKLHPEMKYK